MKKTTRIKRSDYEELKKEYLTKNMSLRLLFVKMNHKTNINKIVFMKIINKIRIEEGYPEYKPGKKAIKKYNKYSHLKK